MDTNSATYVFQYYSHLRTDHERLANRHLAGTMKETRGRSDVAAQAEAKRSLNRLCKLLSDDPRAEVKKISRYWSELLSDDPIVLFLAREGYEAFVLRTGQRILNDHRDQIVLNCCPRCSMVARTPQARQCRFCRYDWHP
jgi:hypothetical protein